MATAVSAAPASPARSASEFPHIRSLPIDAFVDRIVSETRRARAAVITAAPGAGKTTRIPPALADDGPVILLQPRRVAARAIAARIASERGWTLGREVGWQIRLDRRFTRDTRLLVVTEGILTARLQSDPLLTDFRTIVVDEFHERSIHADVALALARQAWRARDDLRIVVMSATLEVDAVSSFLDGCPVVEVPGRLYPLDVSYTPGQSVADAAMDLAGATPGNVLCFLAGAADIRRTISELQPRAGGAIEVLPLYGSLDADEQDAALTPSSRRRIIVATNIAETSLTVPGVQAVVDSGRHKIARYDAERGIDSLEIEWITADAAEQRAGRAGRLGPGVVRRLWDARDRLRPHREPEIHRVDLAASVLDIMAWGGDPEAFQWFEAPRADAIGAAMLLLRRLGFVEAHAPRLTAEGERARALPMHPRLARMLIASGGAMQMAQACAIVAERHLLPPRTAATTSDLLSALDRWRDMPPAVQRAAAEFAATVVPGLSRARNVSDSDFRRAVFAGYPDRIAQRRDRGSPRVKLSTGTGAVVGSESGVIDGEFLAVIDIHKRAAPRESVIRIASLVDPDWLMPTATETVHWYDDAAERVRAARVDRYDALVVAEHPVEPDPSVAAGLLADAWMAREPPDADRRLVRRLRFAGQDVDISGLARAAAAHARTLSDLSLAAALPRDVAAALDRDAPDSVQVPSGRRVQVQYNDDGSVSAAVKLQELFGLADTPRLGPERAPLLLSLLAPNGRPVQVTRDLRSFWDRTYPEVRKELRGRYPKHPWPDDPWTAPPTARTRRR